VLSHHSPYCVCYFATSAAYGTVQLKQEFGDRLSSTDRAIQGGLSESQNVIDD
jgi:hypothetical protein